MRDKVPIAAVFLLSLGFPVHAQSPCLECLKAADKERKECLANAISQEDKNACEDEQKEAAKVCENDECKVEREEMKSRHETSAEKK
jgi:hypothetical protein